MRISVFAIVRCNIHSLLKVSCNPAIRNNISSIPLIKAVSLPFSVYFSTSFNPLLFTLYQQLQIKHTLYIHHLISPFSNIPNFNSKQNLSKCNSYPPSPFSASALLLFSRHHPQTPWRLPMLREITPPSLAHLPQSPLSKSLLSMMLLPSVITPPSLFFLVVLPSIDRLS